MTEDTSHSDTQDEPSVFGNLPRTRPGARSPRRDQAAAARDRAEAKREQAADPPSPEEDAERVLAGSRPGEPSPEAADAPPDDSEEDGGGIEELAWAGVAAAAEAATLGVRLANRALESLRGGSEES